MLRVSGTGTGRLVLTAGKFRNNGTNFYNFKGNRVNICMYLKDYVHSSMISTKNEDDLTQKIKMT